MKRFFARSKYFVLPIVVCTANTARAAEPATLAIVPLSMTTAFVTGNGHDAMVNFAYLNIEVRDLLKHIGEKANMKIIIGDGVQGHVKMEAEPMRLARFLDMLGAAANFAWDRVGTDTIVVVPKPMARVEPRWVAPQLTPRVAPRAVPPNQFSMPGLTAPQAPNPNWRPFEFNGSTIYLVPLQTPQPPSLATTTPKASEPESVKK